jgi:hypothetical protein
MRRREKRLRDRWAAAVPVCCVLALVAGCDGGGRADGAAPPARSSATGSSATGSSATAASTVGPPGPDGRPGCRPPSPIGEGTGGGFPEVRATGAGLQAWGLMMGPGGGRVRTGQEVKIVWRVTGTGDLRLSMEDPAGRPKALSWGPESHGGSSYQRPGDEWGAAYRFTKAGCWRLKLSRGTAGADVWIQVGALRS